MMMKLNITYILFVYYQCLVSSILVIKKNPFPVKMDQDISINSFHSKFKKYDRLAALKLQVICNKRIKDQVIFYPGLDDDPFESIGTSFRFRKFIIKQFKTEIIVQFYRPAHNCHFIISYCQRFNEKKYKTIFNQKILLYKTPKMQMIYYNQDGHQGGIQVNKTGYIECKATDGFPQVKPQLSYRGSIYPQIIKEDNTRVLVKFSAKREHHNAEIICTSSTGIIKRNIKIFHHAQNIQIYPELEYAMPNSKFECQAIGTSYPDFTLSWVISNYSKNLRYFSMWKKNSIAYIKLNSTIPLDSKWNLTCSANNTIPVHKVGGPRKTLYLTIGKDPLEYEKFMQKILKYSVIAIVIGIFLLICIVMIFKCYKQNKKRSKLDQTIIQLQEKSSAPYESNKLPLNYDQNKPFLPDNHQPRKQTVSLSDCPDMTLKSKFNFRKSNNRGDDNNDVIV